MSSTADATTPTGRPVESLRERQLRRRRLVLLGLVIATAALMIFALSLGDYPMPLLDVLRALTGTSGFDSAVVLEWRLPRIFAAGVFAAALATAGALFQTLTRNPLGSPDIIGFSTGAYSGVVFVLVVLGPGLVSASLGALVGGLLTAVIVYVLAYRDGVLGFRLIIVGIGVTGMLYALNLFMLSRARTEVAMGAAIWGMGSLNLTDWADVVPATIAFVVAVPLVALMARPLRQLELGDDAAAAHGVSVERARLGILGLGIALNALVVAVTGPIAFVALAAPQVAARLAGGSGIPCRMPR